MVPQQTLTLSEAGYVLGRSPATLNKAVDTGVIRARQRKVGKAVQRLLGPAELRFLRLSDELDRDLTPAGRRRLYDALRKLAPNAHRVQLGEVDLDLARVDQDLKERLARLDRVREGIDSQEGQPEAVIRGTDIPAHLVAGLAREQSVEEIAEDFPSLTPPQIRAAIEYAKAYPKRGRPYARRSLKRTLAGIAELGVFDDDGSVEDMAPQTLP
jgi:uncharacterized protein (DUF433 family)